jgi:hypothetical protein
VLQLADFVVVCKASFGKEPNKDQFRRLFEVKSQWVLGSAGGALAPMGRMNIQKLVLHL